MSQFEYQGHDRHEHGLNVAPLVLGALDEHELAQFRRHLATCVVCRDEVAVLENVVGGLALAAPQLAPPRGLERRILRAVRADARASTSAGARRPAGRLSVLRPRPVLAGALAAFAVAGAAVATGHDGASTAPPRIVHAQLIGQPAGASADVRISGGQAEIVVRHLPGPPLDKVYEVWLVRGPHAPEATTALFNVTSRGAGAVAVPGNLRGVTAVLVTPEPIGGSTVPTHAPVIAAKLA